jgi:hypothetical protein
MQRSCADELSLLSFTHIRVRYWPAQKDDISLWPPALKENGAVDVSLENYEDFCPFANVANFAVNILSKLLL